MTTTLLEGEWLKQHQISIIIRMQRTSCCDPKFLVREAMANSPDQGLHCHSICTFWTKLNFDYSKPIECPKIKEFYSRTDELVACIT